MRVIDIEKAKTRLSQLVAEAAEGEPFVIARNGKPLVKAVAADAPSGKTGRRLGFMEGEFSIPEDFDRLAAAQIETMFDRSG